MEGRREDRMPWLEVKAGQVWEDIYGEQYSVVRLDDKGGVYLEKLFHQISYVSIGRLNETCELIGGDDE